MIVCFQYNKHNNKKYNKKRQIENETKFKLNIRIIYYTIKRSITASNWDHNISILRGLNKNKQLT